MSVMEAQRGVHLPSSVHSMAAVSAGALQTIFWHPLDLLKTRMQVQGARIESGSGVPAYRSLRHAIVTIMHSEGALGFLRGVAPSIFGSSLAWGIQMPVYARLKQQFSTDQTTLTSERTLFYFAPRDFGCSLLAGCVTNVFVHPVFLVKTRMQLQPRTRGGGSVRPDIAKPAYRSSFNAVQSILREEGFAGLYTGFLPSLLLSTHGAVLLVSYDHFKALYPSVLVASFSAKIFATITTYPLQVVRSVMQQRPPLDGSFPYTSTMVTARILWQRGGVAALYRGIGPQMARAVPQAMAFFSIYEQALGLFSELWIQTQRTPTCEA